MAEEQKPVVVADAPAVEPAAPATETPAEVKPEATEAPAAEPAAETEAAVEEAKPAEPAKKVAEPIYSGALGYKAPGVLKSLIFSKKHFWFGEEEAVPTASLSSYLRGEKPDVAHPVAAWSSQTGKGLLYFAKPADDKKAPTGVLNLSDASDLKKEGTVEFSFRIGSHKHTFETKQALERDGWYLALEKAIEEAKAAAETIKNSEGFKEALEKLNKPAAVAAAGATTTKAEEKAPKKSTEVKPAEGEPRPASSDEEAPKKKSSKSKSRSVSRKRNSIFGSFLGKKEEVEKKEEPKEEAAPAPIEEAAAPAVEAPVVAAPVEAVATEAPAAVEEPKPAETAEVPAAEPVAESSEAPKAIKTSKRNSVIGNFFEKIRSPTQEKKPAEVAPAVPAKDDVKEPEAPAVEEPVAPVVEAAPAAEAAETPAAPVEEAKPAEVPATTPKKEKKGFSFDKIIGSVKEKVKSPVAEKAPVLEAPKAEEAPVAEAPKVEEAPVVEAPAPAVEATEPAKTEETPAAETAAPAEPPKEVKEKRKSSFFGGLTGTVKKEKKPETNGESAKAEEKEKHPSKLSGLFRNPSKAVKSKKEKEAPKTEEAEPVKEEAAAEPVVEEKKEEEPAAPAVIGDVVPEAVTVGKAPAAAPAVPAAA